jgi:hypothetical protein
MRPPDPPPAGVLFDDSIMRKFNALAHPILATLCHRESKVHRIFLRIKPWRRIRDRATLRGAIATADCFVEPAPDRLPSAQLARGGFSSSQPPRHFKALVFAQVTLPIR